MLNKYTYSGKSLEKALELCLESLNCNHDELYIKEQVEEGKLFKSKKITLEVIKKADIITFIKNYIKEVTKNMGIDVNLEVKEKDSIINAIIVSDHNNILIGKDGRTLNSIQLLLRQSLNKEGFNIKINIDASNYKEKKKNNLEREVKKIIKEVLDSKIDAKLDPMNSYERRVVHTLVSEYEKLETESVGVTPNRAIVIKYKEK